MNTASIKSAVQKKLYANSAGRCNLCKTPIFLHKNVHIGEMAHIIGKKTNARSPRFDHVSRPDDIHEYDNLILLCRNCHSEVDQNVEKYTVEVLHDLKTEHESTIKARLDNSKARNSDTESLKILCSYIPMLDFNALEEDFPHKIESKLDVYDMTYAFYKGNPDSYPFYDIQLQLLWDEFLYKFEEIRTLVNSNAYSYGLGSVDIVPFLSDPPCYNFGEYEKKVELYIRNEVWDGYMYINRKQLSDTEVNNVYWKVIRIRDDFIRSYRKLIAFIRNNYPEVDLAGYRKNPIVNR